MRTLSFLNAMQYYLVSPFCMKDGPFMTGHLRHTQVLNNETNPRKRHFLRLTRVQGLTGKFTSAKVIFS